MKQLSFFIVFCIFMVSCKKEDNPTNTTTTTNTEEVKITSWFPEKPMWNNIVEITGTGFPSNINDIQVYFVGNRLGMTPDSTKSRGQILQLTSTKITVRLPYNKLAIGFGDSIPLNNSDYGIIIVDVKNKPRYMTSNNIYYTVRPFISQVNHTTFVGGPLYLGKKFELQGEGFGTSKEGLHVFANGIECQIDSLFYPGLNDNKKIWATLPASIGHLAHYDSTMMVKFEVMRNGVIATKLRETYKCPRLKYKSSNLSTVMSTPTKEIIINGENLFADDLRFSDINNPGYTTIAQVSGAIDATVARSIVPLAQFNLRPPGFYTYQVFLMNGPQPEISIYLGSLTVQVQ